MSGFISLGEVDEIDGLEWSEGGGITLNDKRKIRLAVERFWARRGVYGRLWGRMLDGM